MIEEIRNGKMTVGTTPLILSPPLLSGELTARVIVNTSTGGQLLSLSWGAEASAGSGIVLSAGGTHAESIDNRFIPSTLPLWIVSSAAGGTLSIHERIRR